MELKRMSFVIGFGSCLLLIGCAGLTFSFKYYGMSEVVYDHGTLLGPTEKEDLPFSKCAPNSETKFPCVVMFTQDFFALKQDYIDTKNRLIECEKKK